MSRRPLTRIRSQWRDVDPSPAIAALAPDARVATRNTADGALRVLVALEPAGLHLSISHVDHQGRPRRYPTWDEIADARDVFLPADLGFVMHLPPADEYVAVHDTTFHLHQHPPAVRTLAKGDVIEVSLVDEPLLPESTARLADGEDEA